MAIRGEGDLDTLLGDSSVRARKTPDINCDASSIDDLIRWYVKATSHLLPIHLRGEELHQCPNGRAQLTFHTEH